MQTFSRRDFLKGGASIMAAAIAGTVSSIQKAHAGDFGDVSKLSSLLSIDPVTLQYLSLSSCCTYCESYVIVTHFQPIYFIECIRGSMDQSLMSSSEVPEIKTATTVLTDGYHAFDVRIWEIPGWVIDAAMGYQSCRLCGPGYAPKHTNSNNSNPCSSGKLLGSALDSVNSAMPECIPTLVYDSTLDQVAWRTGCNDIARYETYSSPYTCMQTESMRKEECLGKWGTKYPRQMAKIDQDPRRAAVVAALRALSHSADLGMTEYSGDTRFGKIQQIFPEARIGWFVGSDQATEAIESIPVASNNTYGYTWWLPVVCCKERSKVNGACSPETPCSS